MQVQHKQAIVVLQKVLIVTIFITISAMSAHATTLIGKDIRDILSKIESQAFLNTIYFCKSDSGYKDIPKETIQSKYSFVGNNGHNYEVIYAYSNKPKNPAHANEYVDNIYIGGAAVSPEGTSLHLDQICIINEPNGTQTIGFHATGDALVNYEGHDMLMPIDGIFVPPKNVAKGILDLIINAPENPTNYSFLNTDHFVRNMKCVSREVADMAKIL